MTENPIVTFLPPYIETSWLREKNRKHSKSTGKKSLTRNLKAQQRRRRTVVFFCLLDCVRLFLNFVFDFFLRLNRGRNRTSQHIMTSAVQKKQQAITKMELS